MQAQSLLQNKSFWPLARVMVIWASHPIMHLFKIHILSTHYVPSTMAGTGTL